MKGAPHLGLSLLALASLALPTSACGGKKPPADATESKGEDGAGESGEKSAKKGDKGDKGEEGKGGKGGEGGGEGEEGGKSKASLCTGFELDLVAALSHSACEVAGAKATEVKPVDMKKSLTVKVSASSSKVDPGGKLDVIVQFANKGPKPLELDFMLDPTPRFQIEAYDAKNKRADIPAAREPMVPSGVDRSPSPQTVGRVTIVPNGTAFAKIPWDASKMRWAPEKVKGTPPEMGFPRVAAGPLPKGKYTLKVVTPLLNAAEGLDHEVSAPKITVEFAK